MTKPVIAEITPILLSVSFSRTRHNILPSFECCFLCNHILHRSYKLNDLQNLFSSLPLNSGSFPTFAILSSVSLVLSLRVDSGTRILLQLYILNTLYSAINLKHYNKSTCKFLDFLFLIIKFYFLSVFHTFFLSITSLDITHLNSTIRWQTDNSLTIYNLN